MSKIGKLIELSNIEKKYPIGGDIVKALDGISLSILKNEFIAITGSSGSGKSTLMNILGCLDTPCNGSYYLDGTMIYSDNMKKARRDGEYRVGVIGLGPVGSTLAVHFKEAGFLVQRIIQLSKCIAKLKPCYVYFKSFDS